MAHLGSQAGAIKKGDVFTLAGVGAVNDVSKQATGKLRLFVATADVDTTAGVGTIPCYPPINDGSTSGQAAYQTVTQLPADNAVITINPTTEDGTTSAAANTAFTQNLGFHKNAIALATRPLDLPESVNFKARGNWNGYSIRVVKDFDINDDVEIIRLDMLFGAKVIYPELGVRYQGN